jgi:acetone carboxylase, gamma subunit
LQERAPFEERIVLPFGEHLAIVARPGGGHVTKCLHCSHEFGDYRENYKLECLIHVRDSEEKLLEIYPKMMHGDPQWEEIREYFCPGCVTLLEVEAVAPGYPVVHDFLPDLEGFYTEWLGRPVPTA